MDESSYDELCATYIYGNPDNLDDDEGCYDMAQVTLALSLDQLAYCSDIMDPFAYARIESFMEDCEAYSPPTPSPTKTSEPTNGESISPCEYLEVNIYIYRLYYMRSSSLCFSSIVLQATPLFIFIY